MDTVQLFLALGGTNPTAPAVVTSNQSGALTGQITLNGSLFFSSRGNDE